MGIFKGIGDYLEEFLDASVPAAQYPPIKPEPPRRREALKVGTEETAYWIVCSWCKNKILKDQLYIHNELDNIRYHHPACYSIFKCWWKTRQWQVSNLKGSDRYKVRVDWRQPTSEEALKSGSIAQQYLKLAGVEEPTVEQWELAMECANFYPQSFEELFIAQNPDPEARRDLRGDEEDD